MEKGRRKGWVNQVRRWGRGRDHFFGGESALQEGTKTLWRQLSQQRAAPRLMKPVAWWGRNGRQSL